MDALEDLLRQAEELVDRGDYGGAEGLLLPEREGGNSEVLYLLGLVCYRLEKYQEAVEHLNRAISLKSDYVLALARRGLAYRELGQEQEARADFEQTITIPPQDHKDWRGRGIAFHGLKRYEEAIASYDKALEIKSDDHLVWGSRGYTLFNLGRYEESIASYDHALNIKPDYYATWSNRGIALVNLGRYEEAIASYDKALEIKPDDHNAWYNRGIALVNLGRYEEAIASYDHALNIKPDYYATWSNRGIALVNLGRYEEVIASYDKALEIKPDDHNAWYIRGIALFNLGRYEEAIASCDKAIELKPDYHEAWHGRGSALEKLEKYEDALVSYNKAIELKPDFHEAWHGRGNVLWKLENYEDALVSYNKAIELKPDYHYSWYGRGIALEKLGSYEEAIGSYDKAIELKPDYHEAWNNRGVVLGKLGRYKEAITYFDKAIELKPDYHEAWNGQGSALYCLGSNEEAIVSFSKALEIKPDFNMAWGNWRVLDANRKISLENWLRVRQHCKAGLDKITFEDEPRRHLDIWKYYLWACNRTYDRSKVQELVKEASLYLSRYLAQNPMSEWKEQRFRNDFAGLQQIEVSTLAEAGDIEKALELAEEHRNFRLGWLINGQGSRPAVTTYEQAKQLLNSNTAIIYWHYSPFGLTTFILKHDNLQILLPPALPIGRNIMGNEATTHQAQELETWLGAWKKDYLDYGKNDHQPDDESDSKLDDEGNPKAKEDPKARKLWRIQMRSRLNVGNRSLKLILNIKQLTDEHLQGIENLILIPHRDLHLLPLHFLFPFQFTTTYLPSLQIGLNLQNISQPSTKSLLNLHQPTETPYIKITKDIIDNLNPSVEVQELPNVNKTEFLELLGQNYSALQFMGHGSHKPDEPENSYLNLAEEQLFLKDLRDHQQLDLSSYRLISLVACESGITSTTSLLDEYVGWGSAFLAKRARAVITTLWNVDVRSSAFLMIKFYQLFTPETSAPCALREAQEWMSELQYLGLVAWYEELADLVRESHPQHREYLRTEADKLRNDLRDNPEKMDENDPNTSRPFGDPYHWAGFICTGLLSG